MISLDGIISSSQKIQKFQFIVKLKVGSIHLVNVYHLIFLNFDFH